MPVDLLRAHKPVVFTMRADPNPGNRIRAQLAQGSIMIANAHAETITATLQSTEMKRGMMRIALPQTIVLDR
jgi:hypothetical protein